MSHFKVILSFLILIANAFSCSSEDSIQIKKIEYVFSSAQDKISEKLAKNAFKLFQERSSHKIIGEYNSSNTSKGLKTIYFEVDPTLKYDYCILHAPKTTKLTVRKISDGEWLMLQLIQNLAQEDKRFLVDDLPPALIKLETNCKNFDFIYRDPHYRSNLKKESPQIYGTNNVDNDWGIWGHNLNKVLKNINDTNLFSLVDGERNESQFCFSSRVILDQLYYHIIDNFGDGSQKVYHFMIMPQDNDLVCTCKSCLAIGNTKSNATPAVTFLIEELAKRFKDHRFFTSSYRTTIKIPKKKLEKNVGVFLSTIQLPKGIALTKEQASTANFIRELESWKQITSEIYLWDYSANFDDYLTPIPVLYGLQNQLRFYKKLGIKGLFLNASGYDYSTFEDLKNYVSSTLMMDTEQDIAYLCGQFFKKLYPQNHQLLTSYYLHLEKEFAAKEKAYPMYGGITEINATYLNAQKFETFYTNLKKGIQKTSGKEKDKLSKLLSAISYTRLQIGYQEIDGTLGFFQKSGNELIVLASVHEVLNELKKHLQYPDLVKYKESNGALEGYISNWDELIKQKQFKNQILDQQLEIRSTTDEGFEKSTCLTDGIPGFEMDYHQGWYISSNDLNLQINTEQLFGEKTIQLRFLNNVKHKFLPPERIEVWINGEMIQNISKEEKEEVNVLEYHLTIDFSEYKTIELRMIRNKEQVSKIACDEIRIL